MDARREGFEELEQAFGRAKFTFGSKEMDNTNERYPASHISSSASTLHAKPESSTDYSTRQSPLPRDDLTETSTPPPHQHELSRQASGLPPTPPTTTAKSDAREVKPVLTLDSAPLFADHVRNTLNSRSSGLSTPGIENRSPPTPDSTPPTTGGNLEASLLNHYPSSNSHADSFATAMEGRDDLERDVVSPGLQLGGLETPVEDKLPNLANDKQDTVQDAAPAPDARKVLEHRAAYQRLRGVIQPGDSLKRPDEALIYGSIRPAMNTTAPRTNLRRISAPVEIPDDGAASKASPSIKTAARLSEPIELTENIIPIPSIKSVHPGETRPRREQDTEFLRNVSVRPNTPEPSDNPESESDDAQAPEMPAVVSSPPPTATKRSLDDNNSVYKLIQEENAKRHSSGASDNSIQAAVVLPPPERKRTLRHTIKRESLRGDVIVVETVRRSNTDSPHKLRHTSGQVKLLGDGDAQQSPPAPERSISTKENSTRAVQSDSRNGSFLARQNASSGATSKTSGGHRKSVSLGSSSNGLQQARSHSLRRSSREQRIERSISLKVQGSNKMVDPSSELRRLSSVPKNNLSVAKPRTVSKQSPLAPNREVRRMSLDRTLSAQAEAASQALEATARQSALIAQQTSELTKREALHEPTDGAQIARDSRSGTDHRASADKVSVLSSPRRKSLDPRHLHPTGTPFSQFSVRTEVELCEAKGVEIFPHNNDSLLVIQQSIQPLSRGEQYDMGTLDDGKLLVTKPAFTAIVNKPDDIQIGISHPNHTVDSPLTNPRAAPEPPVIRYIPPTPSNELERTLSAGAPDSEPQPELQRNLSLSQRVRRYSANLVQPLIVSRTVSVRKPQQPRRATTMPALERPTYLSSFWQPRDFWEDYDSEDEEYFEDDDLDILPPGGDTSDVGADADARRRDGGGGFLPRNMSVRMPGFRGAGGFLVGNSLGIDRHGTNSRRPHVVRPQSAGDGGARIVVVDRVNGAGRTHVSSSRGAKAEPLGIAALRAKVGEMRRRRREVVAEKRRDKLRGQIGTRVYHDGR